MLIDLTKISVEEISLAEKVGVDLEDEFARILKPADLSVNLRQKNEEVELKGEIKFYLENECGRCLEKVQKEEKINFRVVYITLEKYEKEQSHEINQADLDVAIFDGEKINLEELVKEQILLQLPTSFLCREDCLGLCRICGNNKNLKNCNCEEKEIDPRWEQLRKLKN